MIEVAATAFDAVKLLQPQLFEDARGYFYESYNQRAFDAAVGATVTFVQDNRSRSRRGTLRGLHYQVKHVQGKLITPLAGTIYDVVVDMRAGSATWGHWSTFILSADDHTLLWVPGGFAHGFLAISDTVELFYKTTDYYTPTAEQCLRWDYDPTIPWPLEGAPQLSEKDSRGLQLELAPPILVK